MSGPMDGERLAAIRQLVAQTRAGFDALRDLLADRDHWEAEAKAWRDQCQVTADHVRGAGVTLSHHAAWVSTQGLRPWNNSVDGVLLGWRQGDRFHHVPHCHPQFMTSDPDGHIATFINAMSVRLDRPAHDILDEMAEVHP